MLLFLWHGSSARLTDPIDRVAALIRQSNVKGLSELFASNVDVTLLGDENVYSKTQAELILQRFFSQNKPHSVTILHKINSSRNYHFGVLIVNTASGNYRVAFTLKAGDNGLMLVELRIEAEKIK